MSSNYVTERHILQVFFKKTTIYVRLLRKKITKITISTHKAVTIQKKT